jgi:hypothetical protein
MSFKLVDKIKKSNLPGPLKKVFEAYVSFGNSDGTSIRPTANKVAKRAGCAKRTVQRHTPTLVRLGFLVHDFNEDGTYRTYSYPKEGVWAYVYHADLSSLANPAIVEGFEIERQAVSEARRRARGKGERSRQLVLFENDTMTETPYDKLAQTLPVILAETSYDKLADRPYPYTSSLRSSYDQTQTDPSAISTAVNEKKNEGIKASVAVAPSANDSAVASLSDQSLKGSGLLADQNQRTQTAEVNPESSDGGDETTVRTAGGLEYEVHDGKPTLNPLDAADAELGRQFREDPQGLAERLMVEEREAEAQAQQAWWDGLSLRDKIEHVGLDRILAIEQLWHEATGLEDASAHRALTCDLFYHGDEDTLPRMSMALKDCPLTAGVKWRSFNFFCTRWKNQTLPNVMAWDRRKRAKQREVAELSRYGCCGICGYRAAESAARGTYKAMCRECKQTYIHAASLLDTAGEVQGAVWCFKSEKRSWIGTKEGVAYFTWQDNEDYSAKCERLMKHPRVMEHIEQHLANLGADMNPRAFDVEEA